VKPWKFFYGAINLMSFSMILRAGYQVSECDKRETEFYVGNSRNGGVKSSMGTPSFPQNHNLESSILPQNQ